MKTIALGLGGFLGAVVLVAVLLQPTAPEGGRTTTTGGAVVQTCWGLLFAICKQEAHVTVQGGDGNVIASTPTPQPTQTPAPPAPATTGGGGASPLWIILALALIGGWVAVEVKRRFWPSYEDLIRDDR